MTATSWEIDHGHSSVNFTVRHLMVSKVHGRFARWTGVLELDPEDITRSSVDVTIDATSVETKEERRDAHLRSADFLDVENFPTLTFRSTAVERVSDDELAVTGDLTIHGVTRSVKLAVEVGGEVKDPWGGTRAGFSAKTMISRKDYGLTWNALLEAGGVAVADRVDIGIEIEAVKAAVGQAA
ncbi:MAG: YceI family protein [Kofleriaceae bacterium]